MVNVGHDIITQRLQHTTQHSVKNEKTQQISPSLLVHLVSPAPQPSQVNPVTQTRKLINAERLAF